MSALIEGIGAISGVLGIVGFLQDNVPGSSTPDGATVRVKVGLSNGDEDGQLDGELAAIYGWDTSNNYLGQGAGSKVSEGGAPLIVIDSSSPGRRTEYLGLSGGKDAICIAWVTVAQNDETRGGAWTGDIGRYCGNDYYPQAEFAGYLDKDAPQTPENRFVPSCTWLDGDHSNDIANAALKFRTLAYGEEVLDTVNNGNQCGATIYGPDTGPINGAPTKRAVKKRAAMKPRPQWIQDRLVVSNITQHSAKELCEDSNSWGPDFVSSKEGQFCDMSTKTLAPLCSASDVDGCLNVDSATNKVTKRTTIGKRAVELAHKSYQKTSVWESHD